MSWDLLWESLKFAMIREPSLVHTALLLVMLQRNTYSVAASTMKVIPWAGQWRTKISTKMHTAQLHGLDKFKSTLVFSSQSPVQFRPDHMLASQSSPHPMAHDMRVCIRMCGVCAPDCSAAVLVYHGISCSTNDQESQIPDANHPRTSMVWTSWSSCCKLVEKCWKIS